MSARQRAAVRWAGTSPVPAPTSDAERLERAVAIVTQAALNYAASLPQDRYELILAAANAVKAATPKGN